MVVFGHPRLFPTFSVNFDHSRHRAISSKRTVSAHNMILGIIWSVSHFILYRSTCCFVFNHFSIVDFATKIWNALFCLQRKSQPLFHLQRQSLCQALPLVHYRRVCLGLLTQSVRFLVQVPNTCILFVLKDLHN